MAVVSGGLVVLVVVSFFDFVVVIVCTVVKPALVIRIPNVLWYDLFSIMM